MGVWVALPNLLEVLHIFSSTALACQFVLFLSLLVLDDIWQPAAKYSVKKRGQGGCAGYKSHMLSPCKE